MNLTLPKALLAMLPVSLLFFGSGILFRKRKTLNTFLQLVGAGCLVIVVLTHFCEAFHLFPWVHSGDEHGVGHYFDLESAVLGLILFPVGSLSDALSEK